jgi:hypothetical protein
MNTAFQVSAANVAACYGGQSQIRCGFGVDYYGQSKLDLFVGRTFVLVHSDGL